MNKLLTIILIFFSFTASALDNIHDETTLTSSASISEWYPTPVDYYAAIQSAYPLAYGGTAYSCWDTLYNGTDTTVPDTSIEHKTLRYNLGTCPVGQGETPPSSLSYSIYTCLNGTTFDDATHTCGAPTCDGTAGTVLDSGYVELVSPDEHPPHISQLYETQLCSGGCSVTVSAIGLLDRRVIDGEYRYHQEVHFIGFYDEVCIGDDDLLGAIPDESCANDHTGGIVDGEYVCYDDVTGFADDPTPDTTVDSDTTYESVTDPDGTVTDTVTMTTTTGTTAYNQTVTHPDGSKTITESIADNRGSTTTVTQVDINGLTVNSTTTTTGGDSAPVQDDTGANFSGGGDCNTPPNCSGDAILCGIARMQWTTGCQGQLSDGQQATDTEIADAVGAGTTLEEIAQGEIIDASDPLGGYVPHITAQCPAGFPFTWNGNTLEIPVTYICDYAETIRPIVLALGFFASSLIFYGGLKEV